MNDFSWALPLLADRGTKTAAFYAFLQNAVASIAGRPVCGDQQHCPFLDVARRIPTSSASAFVFLLQASLSHVIADTRFENVSAGGQSQIIQTDPNTHALTSSTEPDVFEPDNTFSNATYSDLPLSQVHTLHVSNDCDWVRFFADSNLVYEIQTTHLGTNPTIDTVIEIYQEQTPLFDDPSIEPILIETNNLFGTEQGESTFLDGNFTTGFYYVRVCQDDPNDPTYEPGSYRIIISIPVGLKGIAVQVWDLSIPTPVPLVGASVNVTGDGSANGIVDNSGLVEFRNLSPGNYHVNVSVAFADVQGRSRYMPLFDPFRSSNVPSNPASDYGNPRNLGASEFVPIPYSTDLYTVLQFGFIPVAYVDAELRDAITGEPISGVDLQIIRDNLLMTEFSTKPWASYGEPMTSSTNGSFEDRAPIPPNANYLSYEINDGGFRYETKMSALNQTSPAAGGVLDLGEIWLEPKTSGNSIPDGWELEHGITNVSLPSTIDIDFDGLSNLQEYLANTDPLDSNQVFRVNRPPGEDQSEFVLTWDAEPRRIYEIHKNANLEEEMNWIQVHEVTNSANMTTLSWTDPDSMNETHAVYRVDVTGIARVFSGP